MMSANIMKSIAKFGIIISDVRAILSVVLVFILAGRIVYINKKIIYFINKLEDF